MTLTDNSGIAKATWTLGPAVGTQTAMYNVGFGLGFKMTATATAGTVVPEVPSGGILNGAGFTSAIVALSPGAIATIFGTGLSNAPSSGVVPPLMQGTPRVSTISSGTQVTFDGVAAPLFFVSPSQLNVQVPFEVADKASSQVVVNVSGNSSNPLVVPIVDASPAFFTSDSSGKGPVAAFNQDGSRNSSDNGAPPGTVITLFGTGMGKVPPSVVTGWLAPAFPALAYSTSTPSVVIGGLPATVQFSGLAPGFVGLWQINVVVPDDAAGGGQPVSVLADGQNSNPVTLYVK